MKKRYIRFWHGFSPNDKLVQKIATFCHLELHDGKEFYAYDGSLDDFEKLYNSKFIVFDDYIAVTQRNTFGQR